MLYDHYSIDAASADAEFRLAFRLACDRIPGFNPMPLSKGAGRPKSVLKKHRELARAITKLTVDLRVTVIQACRKLAKEDPRWKRFTAKMLQARYYRFAEAVMQEYAMQSEEPRSALQFLSR